MLPSTTQTQIGVVFPWKHNCNTTVLCLSQAMETRDQQHSEVRAWWTSLSCLAAIHSSSQKGATSQAESWAEFQLSPQSRPDRLFKLRPFHANFLQNESDRSEILVNYSCNLQVFLLNGVKHISNNLRFKGILLAVVCLLSKEVRFFFFAYPLSYKRSALSLLWVNCSQDSVCHNR